MFEHPTTIVLGAGASASYGYPLGDTLIKNIIEIGERLGKTTSLLIKEEQLQVRISTLLRFYDPVSIDAFLLHYKEEDHEPLVHQVKELICEAIYEVENQHLFSRGAEDEEGLLSNWYRFFWDAILSGQSPEKLGDPDEPLNFNIITFNYDTSLEYFLNSRTVTEDTILPHTLGGNFLRKLAPCIHHVYGQTLNYQWTGGDENSLTLRIEDAGARRAYASRNAQKILLINDPQQDSHYDKLQCLLKHSDLVVFLGFGFDDTNIGSQVLNLGETLKPRQSNTGANWLPVIKYTNFNNHEIINQKIEAILKQHEQLHEFTVHKSATDTLRPIKSTKKVYQALAEDFTLNAF